MFVHRPIPLSLFLTLSLVACQPDTEQHEAESAEDAAAASASYTDIDVAQLSDMMLSKDFVLVNVHIPYEGDIPGTDLSIPYDQIDQALDQLGHASAKIVLYCRSGNMSATASARLAELGYLDVYNLAGGMRAWAEAGYELEQSGGEP
jgi:rhodanese-related sulfurtransferase